MAGTAAHQSVLIAFHLDDWKTAQFAPGHCTNTAPIGLIRDGMAGPGRGGGDWRGTVRLQLSGRGHHERLYSLYLRC